MHGLVELRHNMDIFRSKGYLSKSSYRRLAEEDACTGISETQAMLSQIELKEEYKPIPPQRILHQIQALTARKEELEEDPTVSNVLLDPDVARNMDYHTTMTVNYRLPYPIKPKPLPPPPPPELWLLNRRTVGYSLRDLENRDGINTFLDDNMQMHYRIAELKMTKNKFYEMITNVIPPSKLKCISDSNHDESPTTYH